MARDVTERAEKQREAARRESAAGDACPPVSKKREERTRAGVRQADREHQAWAAYTMVTRSPLRYHCFVTTFGHMHAKNALRS